MSPPVTYRPLYLRLVEARLPQYESTNKPAATTGLFLLLPTEIGHLIYRHLFSSVTIVIGSKDQLDSHGVLLDDFWGVRWHCSADDAFYISPSEGFWEYEDRYDKVLKRRNPLSDQDALNFLKEARKRGWSGYDRDRNCPGGWQPLIDSESFSEVSGILEVCRRVREEALSVMGSSLELVVLDAGFRIEDLPRSFRQHWLSQIQYVTFAGDDSEVEQERKNFDARYKYDFDVREMPALKTLHVRDRNEPHLKKVYVEHDEDVLRSCAFGAKDQEWIEYWFQQQTALSCLEEASKNQLNDPLIEEIINEKNAGRYWLRDLMFDARKRIFQVIKRLQVTLELIQLPAHIPKDHRPVIQSQLQGRYIMYVDLDFDIDTREVLTRMAYDHKDRELESPRSLWFCSDKRDVPMGTSSDIDWIIPDDTDVDESETSDED